LERFLDLAHFLPLFPFFVPTRLASMPMDIPPVFLIPSAKMWVSSLARNTPHCVPHCWKFFRLLPFKSPPCAGGAPKIHMTPYLPRPEHPFPAVIAPPLLSNPCGPLLFGVLASEYTNIKILSQSLGSPATSDIPLDLSIW